MKDNRRVFLDFCDTVRNTEKDKDKFLEAAKLQRIERQPMSDDKFETLCVLIGFCVFFVCFTAIVLSVF